MEKTKILIFDRYVKGEMLEEFLRKDTRIFRVIQSYEPKEALEEVIDKDIDIILLGGDVENELKTAAFAKLLIDNNLHKKPFILITTWDSDEARLLKAMLPDILYVPFCESVANIVKEKGKKIRINKRIQNGRKQGKYS